MANRFTFPRETALDANGNPLAGARLYFYEAGATNPADSFADEALTIANANPVVADSAGRFGDIFLQAIDYKVILKDAADVTIWTADPVQGTIDASGDKFIPSQQSPADMTVLVGPGTIWDAVAKTRLTLAAQTTALITAPLTNPRNDIVYLDRVTGVVGVATGAEAVSPTDPAIPDGKLPVARARLAITTIEIDASLLDDIRELELLGAGTAAVRDTGVADGQIPLMDAAGYPAADGGRITNVHSPRGYIDGLILSNGTDADHDIDIAPGLARDEGNAADLSLAAALTKQIDAPWAAGNNLGGLDASQIDGAQTVTFADNGASDDFMTIDSGSWTATPSVGDTLIVVGGTNAGTYQITAATSARIDVPTASFTGEANSGSEIYVAKANTWHHIWLIGRSDTGVVDALFSESATAPVLSAGYDRKRRIGAVLTDGTANIVAFFQHGDIFTWKTRVNNPVASTTTATLATTQVPTGISVVADLIVSSTIVNAGYAKVSSPNEVDTTLSAIDADFGSALNTHTDYTSNHRKILTNISGEVRVKSTLSITINVMTLGWIDPLGKNE